MFVEKVTIIKKSWKKDEDERLLALVAEHRCEGSNESSNWTVIAGKMKSRTGKQCRERYHNHLKEEIVKGKWTKDEDALINSLQKQLGNQWTRIAKFLPGRSDNAVKNRWHIQNRVKNPKHSDGSGVHIKRQTKVPKLSLPPGYGKMRAYQQTPNQSFSLDSGADNVMKTTNVRFSGRSTRSSSRWAITSSETGETARSLAEVSPLHTWRILDDTYKSSKHQDATVVSSLPHSSEGYMDEDKNNYDHNKNQNATRERSNTTPSTNLKQSMSLRLRMPMLHAVVSPEEGSGMDMDVDNSDVERAEVDEDDEEDEDQYTDYGESDAEDDRGNNINESDPLNFEFSDEECGPADEDEGFFTLLEDGTEARCEPSSPLTCPRYRCTSGGSLPALPFSPRNPSETLEDEMGNQSPETDFFQAMITQMLKLSPRDNCSRGGCGELSDCGGGTCICIGNGNGNGAGPSKNVNMKRFRTHSLEGTPR